MALPTFFTRDNEGTFRDVSGKVIVYGLDRFVNEICLGGHCFVCGASPTDCEFNDEHIIPQWVLKFADQARGTIGLPNQTLFRGYSGYTVPCCVRCNSELGATFEEELSRVVCGGYEATMKYLQHNGPLQIFRWLALLYLKTHLRDARMRNRLDRRSGDHSTICDVYEWHDLHHVHCVARSHYTGIAFDVPDIGTLMVLPAATASGTPMFDYADVYLGRAVMIRIGEVAMLAVMNDSSIVLDSFPRAQQVLKDRRTKPLEPLQLRELYAGLVWRNLCLQTRPNFSTVLVPKPHFSVDYPSSIRFDGPLEEIEDRPSYGKLLHALCREHLDLIAPDKRREAEESMLNGTLTFFNTDVPWWPEDKR